METIVVAMGASLQDLKDLVRDTSSEKNKRQQQLINQSPVPEIGFMKTTWETEAILVIKDEILNILLKTKNKWL